MNKIHWQDFREFEIVRGAKIENSRDGVSGVRSIRVDSDVGWIIARPHELSKNGFE